METMAPGSTTPLLRHRLDDFGVGRAVQDEADSAVLVVRDDEHDRPPEVRDRSAQAMRSAATTKRFTHPPP